MFARITTVAFEGIEARPVDVQVQVAPGLPAFIIVGLPDKAVAESRERGYIPSRHVGAELLYSGHEHEGPDGQRFSEAVSER